MTEQDLAADGMGASIESQVLRRADQALSVGAHGLIASPLEVVALRNRFGAAPLLITPGVRPNGTDQGDQARVMTPAEAIKAGADALVIGRPIVKAVAPKDMARRILDEINSAT